MTRALALALLLLTLAPCARAEDAAADARVGRIVLEQAGTYRIEPRQLKALGIPSALHAEVRRAGKAVLHWRDGTAAGERGSVFFAAREPASAHSRYGVYEVWRLAKAAAPASAPAGIPNRREDARDRVLGALPAASVSIYGRSAPVWFLGLAPRGQSFPVELGRMGAEPGSAQQLVADVYATWRGPVVMKAVWDGVDLGPARVVHALGGARLVWEVPADVLPRKGTARLQLSNVSPPPPPPPERDVSRHRGTVFVDAVRLEGPADATWTWRDARPVTVVKAGAPKDPLRQAGKARHVILAVPALLEPARALAAHRTKQGTPSVVVPVLDVYDRYGHGEHVPIAIRHFLDALRAREGAPLDYVVLAGDATYNRTDRLREPTIPAPMTRSKYNGATASDRLYVLRDDPEAREPAIGRLPFRTAAAMKAYVERLIRYETEPPAHASRRMLRFVTSEGRFNPIIDKIIEGRFRSILARQVPPAYDIEVTYANPRSPFLWPPPELSAKVIQGLNDGALFFTYVGHGFEKGFDTLRIGDKRYGILHVRDVPQVDITRGTAPIVCVLACTTAMFDGVKGDGIGEALLKRPNGPVAYWGASRICHPLYNAFIGQAMASNLAKGGELDTLGKILATSRKQAPALAGGFGRMLTLFPAVDDLDEVDRLFVEGAHMYMLLGDPALKVAFPKAELALQATHDVPLAELTVDIEASLPDGTEVQVSIEAPRNEDRAKPDRVDDPRDPASFATIRKNHARMNDRAYKRATVKLKDGKAKAQFGWRDPPFHVVVKAWCIAKGEVHQNAMVLKVP